MPGSSGARAELRDARRPLVHRQERADAVAGAVVVVEAGLPERGAREAVELRAGRADRKARGGDGDVALEHAGEAVAHLRRRRADGDGAGDVGGAVAVLAAGIDEVERAGLEPPRRSPASRGSGRWRRSARRRRSCRRRGRRARSRRGARCRRGIRASFSAAAISSMPAGRRRAVEPGEEAHHRRAVADMRARARRRSRSAFFRALRQRRPGRRPRRSCRRRRGSRAAIAVGGRLRVEEHLAPSARRARRAPRRARPARGRRRVRRARRGRCWRACARR